MKQRLSVSFLFLVWMASVAVAQSGWQRLPLSLPPEARREGTGFFVGTGGDFVFAHVVRRSNGFDIVVTAYLSGSWRPSRVIVTGGPDVPPAYGYWDEIRQLAVVCAGRNVGQGESLSVWEWVPGQPTLSNAYSFADPSAGDRGGANAAFFDSARGIGLVLMRDGTVVEYTGGTSAHWIDPPVRPVSVGLRASCFDDSRRRIWALPDGGTELWEYDVDGRDWVSARPLPVEMPVRVECAVGYDPSSRSVVLFGGMPFPASYVSTPLRDTWEFDGLGFQRTTGLLLPVARQRANWAWDRAASRLVLFSGTNSPSIPSYPTAYTTLGDMWAYRSGGVGGSYSTSGAGCAGTAATPTLAVAPQHLPLAGRSFSVMVQNVPMFAPVFMMVGTSDQSWRGTPLPFGLGAFGAAGCSMWTGPELVYPAPNVLGTALWTLAIPVSLGGATFFNQAVVFDPGANAAGLTVSDLGRAVVGS